MRRLLSSLLCFAGLLVSSVGYAAWSPAGSPVCDAPGIQGDLVAVPFPWEFEIWHGQSLFAVWSDPRDTVPAGSDLYDERIDALGPPSPPTNGSAAVVAPGYQGAPDADFTGYAGNPPTNSGVIVAWSDNRNGALDVYAKRLLDSPFNTPWPADGVPVCMAAGVQFAVHVVGDLNAGAIVSWLDARAGSNAIYAQRLDQNGVAQWAADGIPVCDVPAYRYQHRLAAAPDGGAYFVWLDDQDGPLRVRALRLLPDGTRAPGWPAGGFVVSSLAASQLGPPRVDPASGALFVTFYSDVPRVNRVDDTGAIHAGWPADGVALAATPVFGAGFLTDAIVENGAFVALWSRNTTPSGSDYFLYDLVAQRILADGTRAPGWGAEGNVVCDTQGDPMNGRLAAGPFIVAVWEDSRNPVTGPDLYAMRLREDGAPDPLWPTNGVAVAAGSGRQVSPRPVWDGDQGVLVAYLDDHDFDSSHTDVYAQRINLNGTVGTTAVPPAVATGFGLAAPVPNPARGTVTLALALPAGATVAAEVLDALGRHVRTLSGVTAAASLRWNLADDAGARVQPGVYYVRVRGAVGSLSRAVVVRR